MFFIDRNNTQLCTKFIYNQILIKMKIHIILVLAFIGLSCSSPKAKDSETKPETKTEVNSTADNSNDTKKASSQSSSITTPVKGEVKMEFSISDLNSDGESVDLIGMFVDKKFLAESATIQAGGKFMISGDELYPKGFYFIVLPNKSVIKLLLDNDQVFKFTASANDIDGTAILDGSQTIKLYYEDLKFKKGIDKTYGPIARKVGSLSPQDPNFKSTYKEFLRLSKKYTDQNDYLLKKYPDNFFTKFKVGGKNPILTFPTTPSGDLDVKTQVQNYRNNFWDGFDFNEAGLINTPAFTNKLKRYFKELVGQNQDAIIKYTDVLMGKAGHNSEYYKVITNWIALEYEPGKTSLMDGEAVYSHIILKYFTPEKATWYDEQSVNQLRNRANEMTQSLLGKPMGDITARGFDGKIHTLSDIKAPVIIVYIYNPDCEHCETETPLLMQFYRQWKNKGVEVFSIAANTTELEWKGFHDRFNMPWTDIFDASNVSWYPKYFVDVTPELYVIDRNRKIFAKNLKVGQLQTIMDRINK